MRCPVCKGTGDVTPKPGGEFVMCDVCVDGEFTIRSGSQFEWVGLPPLPAGFAGSWLKVLDVRLGGVDVESSAGNRDQVGVADFVAMIEQGWLAPL